MRVNSNGEHSYGEHDPGYLGVRDRVGGLMGKFRSGAENVGSRFNSNGGFMSLHEKIWSKLTFFTSIGFIGLIVWLVAKLFSLAVPAKWTFLKGLLSICETVGWWALVICAGILILGWLLGAFCKFQDWLRSKL